MKKAISQTNVNQKGLLLLVFKPDQGETTRMRKIKKMTKFSEEDKEEHYNTIVNNNKEGSEEVETTPMMGVNALMIIMQSVHSRSLL